MHRDSNCASQIEIVLVQLSASERERRGEEECRSDQRWTYIPDLQFDTFLLHIDHFGAEFGTDRVSRVALD